MSFVLVSPSMEMLLKDLSTAAERRDCKADGVMGASVQMMPRRVAMFGWIIPAPGIGLVNEACIFDVGISEYLWSCRLDDTS